MDAHKDIINHKMEVDDQSEFEVGKITGEVV